MKAVLLLLGLGVISGIAWTIRRHQIQQMTSRCQAVRDLVNRECPKDLPIVPVVYRWTHPDEKVKPRSWHGRATRKAS